MKHQYLIQPASNWVGIVHVGSNNMVGSAHLHGGKYHVQTDQDDDAGVVQSLDEVIPALLAYCEKHPARWQGNEATGYSKCTHFGDARIEQDQSGRWTAYRNGEFALLKGGSPALFGTSTDARRAADAHLADGLPFSKTISDGYSWEPDPLE